MPDVAGAIEQMVKLIPLMGVCVALALMAHEWLGGRR